MIPELNFVIAVTTVRILAGILFFFQGYDKVFNVGMTDLKNTMKAGVGDKKIPDGFIGFVAYFSSWTELLCGFLLIIGFFTYPATYLLCLDLLILSTGFSLARPMWETGHVLIRMVLLVFILVTPREWDLFSLDHLFSLSKLI